MPTTPSGPAAGLPTPASSPAAPAPRAEDNAATVAGTRPKPVPQPSFPAGHRVLQPDEVLASRYRIVRFLAKGGMGEVYEAEDLELRQRVALKTISSERSDQVAIDRFKREIALARTVTHPNVCRIFDLGQHVGAPGTEPINFLTMELLQGETLAERLKRGGRMAPEDALALVQQIAEALDAAHQAHIVHRDLKSENVFLVPGSGGLRAVVTDFGVARGGATSDQLASRVTGTGIVGTPAYMAPEQVSGEPVTQAADVYALGVVIYEMVTGRLPFESDNPLTSAVKRLQEPPIPPHVHVPDLPPMWERTILRCLERRPEARFASAGEAARALTGMATQVATHAPMAGAPVVDRPSTSGPTAGTPTVGHPGVGAPGTPTVVTGTGVEPVAAGAPPTLESVPAQPEAAKPDRSRVLALALATVVAISAGLYLFNRSAEERERVVPRRSVAVLGFRNLTGSEDVAWLETALSEMLTTELAHGTTLRTIPGENVAGVQRQLGIAADSPLSEELRGKVRSLLGCDYLVLGSFARVQVAERGEIRLDLRLEDAALGSTLASLSENGGEEDLFAMVGRLGAALRAELGAGAAGDGEDPLAGLPTDPEAARQYAEALEELRAARSEEARELLQKAAMREPQNPLIHSALSSAWEAQGYLKRAAEAAERAFELSSHLPREDRLVVEGRYREAQGDYPAAAEIYTTLSEFFPDEVEYGLRLAAAENQSRRPHRAVEAIERLKLLPSPISDDPRIDLAEATAAGLLAEFERQLEAAGRAAERAEVLGAARLVAQARLAQAQAYRLLGQPRAAAEAAQAARDLYGQIESPADAALALTTLANARVDLGEFDAAAMSYREAISAYQRISHRGGEASALNNLALVLKKKGDLDAAQELYQEAEVIYRETDDRLGLANALNNQGVLLVQRDQLKAALSSFEQSQAIWEETGEPASQAYGLNNVAAVLRLQGNLWDSRTMHERALDIRRGTGQKLAEVTSLTNLGIVLIDLGDLVTAGELLTEALELAREMGERSAEADALAGLGDLRLADGELTEAREAHAAAMATRSELEARRQVTESRIALTRVALAEGEFATAEIAGQNAARLCRRDGQSSDEAVAWALVAQALARQRRFPEARQAIAEAIPLADPSERAAVQLEVRITAAALRAQAGKPVAAAEQLARLEQRAEELGYVGLRLEAGFAWARARRRAGAVEEARQKLDGLRTEAQSRGFLQIAQHVETALRHLDA